MTAATVLIAVLIHGCTALGWTFGPGLSSKSTTTFAAQPVIVHRGDSYFLAWTYGSDAFPFLPNYKPMEGRLVFTLQGMSSAWPVAGRRDEILIEGAEAVLALQRGGAYWWEPDGSFVELRVVESE